MNIEWCRKCEWVGCWHPVQDIYGRPLKEPAKLVCHQTFDLDSLAGSKEIGKFIDSMDHNQGWLLYRAWRFNNAPSNIHVYKKFKPPTGCPYHLEWTLQYETTQS